MNQEIPAPISDHHASSSLEEIADMVKVDGAHRAHRPDGKFLSHHEVNQINAHQAIIRAEQPISDLPTQDFRFEAAELPDLNEANPRQQMNGLRAFLQRRQMQLSDFGVGIQKLFSEDIHGIHFTPKEMVQARFAPAQLEDNVRANLPLDLSGRQSQARQDIFDFNKLDPIIDNPVLRTAAYKKAMAGDALALDYLTKHDTKFAVHNPDNLEAVKVALALFSGYAAIRKIGLYAAAGATLAQMLRPNMTPERLAQLKKKMDALSELDSMPAGTVKYEREKRELEALRRRSQPPRPYSDPFDF